MLTIRLQRVGKKKFATYRLIISEKARDTHGAYLEALGNFNPHAKENAFQPNIERIKYWIGKGAELSDTVHNLLVTNGIIEDKKKKSVYLSKKRKAKLAEKKKQPKADSAPTAEAPVVEKPALPSQSEVYPAEGGETEPAEKSEVEEKQPVEAPAEKSTEKSEEVKEDKPAEQPAEKESTEKSEEVKEDKPAEAPAAEKPALPSQNEVYPAIGGEAKPADEEPPEPKK